MLPEFATGLWLCDNLLCNQLLRGQSLQYRLQQRMQCNPQFPACDFDAANDRFQ